MKLTKFCKDLNRVSYGRHWLQCGNPISCPEWVADAGEARSDASVLTEENDDGGLVGDGTKLDRTSSFCRYFRCRKDSLLLM